MKRESEWILCPVCGNKTSVKIREDTVLKNYPLYCPKCKRETLIEVKDLQVTIIEGLEARTRAEENLMELQAKKEKAQGEYHSILKILIVTFSSFFVLNMVLNYFFPEINFNNLLGLPSIAIAAILLVKWFFKNYEIKPR